MLFWRCAKLALAKKNWIDDAIKKPGSLRAQAKREGAINKQGKIDRDWLEEKAKSGKGKTKKRAVLAITLIGLSKKKGK